MVPFQKMKKKYATEMNFIKNNKKNTKVKIMCNKAKKNVFTKKILPKLTPLETKDLKLTHFLFLILALIEKYTITNSTRNA